MSKETDSVRPVAIRWEEMMHTVPVRRSLPVPEPEEEAGDTVDGTAEEVYEAEESETVETAETAEEEETQTVDVSDGNEDRDGSKVSLSKGETVQEEASEQRRRSPEKEDSVPGRKN